MHKFKQLLCLLLVVSSLFTLFSVNVIALDNENLVSSDLRTWSSGSTVDSTLIDPYQFFYDEVNNFNRVNIEFPYNETFGSYLGNSILYKLPEIQVSETYQFSFTFPSLSTIQTLFPHITDTNQLKNFFGSSTLIVGIGSIDPVTNKFEVYDDSFFIFDTDDISSITGKTFTQSFNLKQIKGTPFFGISVTSSSQRCSFFIQNVALVKVQNDNDKKLDGILGWLQELWNSITGGFDRIQNKIGEVITNLSGELQSVKEGITTKLGEVITNLSGELQSVKEGITTKLGEVITGLTNELRLVTDSIKNFFIPSDDYFINKKNEMQLILQDNLGAIYQVSNLLDDFFTSFNGDVTVSVIEVPVLTVDLLGYPFSFGGWIVPLLPDGRLQFLADSCKFVIGVLTTFAFLHGLRKKYDEIVGGVDD